MYEERGNNAEFVDAEYADRAPEDELGEMIDEDLRASQRFDQDGDFNPEIHEILKQYNQEVLDFKNMAGKFKKRMEKYADANWVKRSYYAMKDKVSREPDYIKQFEGYMRKFERLPKKLSKLIADEEASLSDMEAHRVKLYGSKVKYAKKRDELKSLYDEKHKALKNGIEQYKTHIDELGEGSTEAIEQQHKNVQLEKQLFDLERERKNNSRTLGKLDKTILAQNQLVGLKSEMLQNYQERYEEMITSIEEEIPIYKSLLSSLKHQRVIEDCLRAEAEFHKAINDGAQAFANITEKHNKLCTEISKRRGFSADTIEVLMDTRQNVIEEKVHRDRLLEQKNKDDLRRLAEKNREINEKHLRLTEGIRREHEQGISQEEQESAEQGRSEQEVAEAEETDHQ